MSHLAIRTKGDEIWAYIVQSYYDGNGNRKVKYLRRATDEEVETHLQSIKARKKMVRVACTNPDCNKMVWITRDQKQKFFTTFPKRYGKFKLPYCCKECQDAHYKDLMNS